MDIALAGVACGLVAAVDFDAARFIVRDAVVRGDRDAAALHDEAVDGLDAEAFFFIAGGLGGRRAVDGDADAA